MTTILADCKTKMTNLNLKAIDEQLRDAGLKPTRQRIAIADILFRDGHKHVSAEDLHEEVKKSNIHVSLATVYNTLHQFTTAGLLQEVSVDGAKTYFDTNTHEHQHFFLEDTNEVMDLEGISIDKDDIANVPDNMEIVRIDVVVRLREKSSKA